MDRWSYDIICKFWDIECRWSSCHCTKDNLGVDDDPPPTEYGLQNRSDVQISQQYPMLLPISSKICQLPYWQSQKYDLKTQQKEMKNYKKESEIIRIFLKTHKSICSIVVKTHWHLCTNIYIKNKKKIYKELAYKHFEIIKQHCKSSQRSFHFADLLDLSATVYTYIRNEIHYNNVF